MKIAVLFDCLGPYHVARLNALNAVCDLLVIELRNTSADYEWQGIDCVPFIRRTILSKCETAKRCFQAIVYKRVQAELTVFNPDVVVTPGWYSGMARSAIFWAGEKHVPVVVMSDSQEIDFPRRAWKEWVKRSILRSCSGGFVGGTSHRDYLVKLGMSEESIRLGYDVVDNHHFRHIADRVRANKSVFRERLGMPERYFLTVSRFIEKKNLAGLIDAFHKFVEISKNDNSAWGEWSLVILGDGPLKANLLERIRRYGLERLVYLPGFIQYNELPSYYALASALILPSKSEQWGLVVNEAMASSLPVLVSERCGVSVDLVDNGVNGYVFSPYNLAQLVSLMCELAKSEDVLKKMGRESARIIGNWSPSFFAENLLDLARWVLSSRIPRRSFSDRALLSMSRII